MRLTKKNGINYIPRHRYRDYNAVLNEVELEQTYQHAIDKLGQLEDIEDELGIDLIILFKALKNGIHKKIDLDICFDTKLRFMRNEWYLAQPFDENYQYIVNTKDYGKTWALDKNDLTSE